MATAKFDTLAAANELQAAGIAEAHAEAIVNTAGQAVDGLLTESRFEAAMDEMRAEFREQRAYLDQRLADQTVALQVLRSDMEQGLAEQTAARQALRSDMEAGFAKQAAALESGLAKQAAALETGLAQQLATMAKYNAEIYRYLWVHGSMIILVLCSLYAMVESWARAQA